MESPEATVVTVSFGLASATCPGTQPSSEPSRAMASGMSSTLGRRATLYSIASSSRECLPEISSAYDRSKY
jgi:hypothetical protein